MDTVEVSTSLLPLQRVSSDSNTHPSNPLVHVKNQRSIIPLHNMAALSISSLLLPPLRSFDVSGLELSLHMMSLYSLNTGLILSILIPLSKHPFSFISSLLLEQLSTSLLVLIHQTESQLVQIVRDVVQLILHVRLFTMHSLLSMKQLPSSSMEAYTMQSSTVLYCRVTTSIPSLLT